MNSEQQPRIRAEVQVMFFDTDCGVSCRILPTSVSSKLRDLACGRAWTSSRRNGENQKYPVVVRTEIDYRCAAKLGDKLVIDGWLDDLQRARFWCAFRITRPADEALIAECRQTLAWLKCGCEIAAVAGRLGKISLSRQFGLTIGAMTAAPALSALRTRCLIRRRCLRLRCATRFLFR